MNQPARVYTQKQSPKAGKVIYMDFQRKQRRGITLLGKLHKLDDRLDKLLASTADFMESKQANKIFLNLLALASIIFLLHMLVPAISLVDKL